MQVDTGDERLVVEHLLEMRHVPVLVDRVAGEAAAEMVVDAARGHRLQGVLDHLERRRPRPCGRGARRRRSNKSGWGNFGAEPNPP